VSRLPFLYWAAFFASFPLSEEGAVLSLSEPWNFRLPIVCAAGASAFGGDFRFGLTLDIWLAAGTQRVYAKRLLRPVDRSGCKNCDPAERDTKSVQPPSLALRGNYAETKERSGTPACPSRTNMAGRKWRRARTTSSIN